MEALRRIVGRYVAIGRVDGLSTIFDSIRAVHPELSAHALVAQARVLKGIPIFETHDLPEKDVISQSSGFSSASAGGLLFG